MCEFFSFVSDGKDFYYIGAKQRLKYLHGVTDDPNAWASYSFRPDSHTTIANSIVELNKRKVIDYTYSPDDKVNKYEFWYNPKQKNFGTFHVDQINLTIYDSSAAEKWVRGFVKTQEFQDIIDATPSQYLYFKNPTNKVIVKSVNNYGPEVLGYIKKELSSDAKAKIIETDPRAIEYIKNPSERLVMKALEADSELIKYIKNPSYKALKFAVDQLLP